jgi:hypothetical protein
MPYSELLELKLYHITIVKMSATQRLLEENTGTLALM